MGYEPHRSRLFARRAWRYAAERRSALRDATNRLRVPEPPRSSLFSRVARPQLMPAHEGTCCLSLRLDVSRWTPPAEPMRPEVARDPLQAPRNQDEDE